MTWWTVTDASTIMNELTAISQGIYDMEKIQKYPLCPKTFLETKVLNEAQIGSTIMQTLTSVKEQNGKQSIKALMMLNNRKMQISILKINRQNRITLLNSRYLESRYVHVLVKFPKIQYGS